MRVTIDYTFYANVYGGGEVSSTSFPTLLPTALRQIGNLTRWVDPDTLDDFTTKMYKFAVCAQMDFLAVNGLDYANSLDGGGFTVGKVTVHGRSGSASARVNFYSPEAISYLEQTGLLNPAVPVVGCCRC